MLRKPNPKAQKMTEAVEAVLKRHSILRHEIRARKLPNKKNVPPKEGDLVQFNCRSGGLQIGIIEKGKIKPLYSSSGEKLSAGNQELLRIVPENVNAIGVKANDIQKIAVKTREGWAWRKTAK